MTNSKNFAVHAWQHSTLVWLLCDPVVHVDNLSNAISYCLGILNNPVISICFVKCSVANLIKHSMIVIYDCRVILTRKLLILRISTTFGHWGMVLSCQCHQLDPLRDNSKYFRINSTVWHSIIAKDETRVWNVTEHTVQLSRKLFVYLDKRVASNKMSL